MHLPSRTIRLLHATLIALAAPIAPAARVAAQTVPPPLAVGARVRVTTGPPDAGRRVAPFVAMDSLRVVLALTGWYDARTGRPVERTDTIPLAEVQRLEVSAPGSRGSGRATAGVVGLLVGGLAGGGIAGASLQGKCGSEVPCGAIIGAAAAGGALVGLIVGLAVGHDAGERWHVVPLPPGAGDPTGARARAGAEFTLGAALTFR